jgi:c-di-GMP-binding flagellar brake protein YcgR
MMAVGIKRIEKEFLLKSVMDEQIPVTMHLAGKEESLAIAEIGRDSMRLLTPKGLEQLKKGSKVTLFFRHHEQVINFVTDVIEHKGESLTVVVPESLYKNLSRKYTRILFPPALNVEFSFRGERYELDYPKVELYEPAEEPEFSDDFQSANIKSIIEQMNAKAEEYASDHRVVMFREREPESVEERVIARTGKVFFLPSTLSEVPSVDPYVAKKLVTRQILESFLMESGSPRPLVRDIILNITKSKRNQGILGELLYPILFQEYVIGYIFLQNRQAGKPPLDLDLVDAMGQFAKVIAYSLRANGYFKGAPLKHNNYRGAIVDISASGILFANEQALLAQSLLVDSEIDLSLSTKERKIQVAGMIVRRYKDANQHYYGVDFRGMQPEDMRYLFELLYGRPFTDRDILYMEGGTEARNPLFE